MWSGTNEIRVPRSRAPPARAVRDSTTVKDSALGSAPHGTSSSFLYSPPEPLPLAELPHLETELVCELMLGQIGGYDGQEPAQGGGASDRLIAHIHRQAADGELVGLQGILDKLE